MNKKSLYILLSVLAVILVAVIVLAAVMLAGENAGGQGDTTTGTSQVGNTTDNAQTGEETQNSGAVDSITGDSITDGEEETAGNSQEENKKPSVGVDVGGNDSATDTTEKENGGDDGVIDFDDLVGLQ